MNNLLSTTIKSACSVTLLFAAHTALASEITPLTQGQWTPVFSGAEGSNHLFSFVMPDADNVRIQLQATEGDADLYAGVGPDTSTENYTHRSNNNDSNERITLVKDITYQLEGTYYINVNGWREYQDAQVRFLPILQGDQISELQVGDLASVSAQTGQALSYQVINLTDEMPTIDIILEGDNGDADLEVDLIDPLTNAVQQTLTSASSSSNESISVERTNQRLVIRINAWSSFEKLELAINTPEPEKTATTDTTTQTTPEPTTTYSYYRF